MILFISKKQKIASQLTVLHILDTYNIFLNSEFDSITHWKIEAEYKIPQTVRQIASPSKDPMREEYYFLTILPFKLSTYQLRFKLTIFIAIILEIELN